PPTEETGEDAETDKERERLEAQLEKIRDQLEGLARTLVNAEKAYQQARQDVLARNVTPAELERVLALSTQPEAEGQPSPREKAVDKLAADHPSQADLIRELMAAHDAYEEVRGPLDDPNDLIALLKGSGVLEFRIAATPGVTGEDGYREQLKDQGPRAGADQPYRWFPIDSVDAFAETDNDREALEADAAAYFANRGQVGAAYGDDYYLLLANTDRETLTPSKPGWELVSAGKTLQEGLPAVSFKLNAIGGQYMAQMTGRHVGEPMAILLDGKAISAPNLQSQIGGSGVITGGRGGFGQAELQYLVRTLRAGSVEGSLSDEPISIKTTGPRFGQDNLNAGLNASIWALVLVAAFIAVYYLFWGLLADFALMANMVIILGLMALLDATFTLPGIAGIVLTIGMAVDANVLIFERIREEQDAGTGLRAAVRTGYDKALSTVLDANITTLIVCIVLAYTATAEVKGFATTLGIGILATLFTALFMTRVIADIYLEIARPKSLPQLPSIATSLRNLLSPSIDWVGKRPIFFTLSVILVAGGISMVAVRGESMLDIEFQSGTEVSFELSEGEALTVAEARKRLTAAAEAADQPALRGDQATVVTVGKVVEGAASKFSVQTLQTDVEIVSEVVKTAFDDVIDTTHSVQFAAADQEQVAEAPVYPVTDSRLGEVINRSGVETDVSAWRGGVAVVVEGMKPALTLQQLRERIGKMQLQPGFEGTSYRQFDVIGLELADVVEGGAEPVYRSVVVLARDQQTDYAEQPDAFVNPLGLAATQWKLVRESLVRASSLDSVSNFSSQISATMQQQAIVALTLSLLAVVIYIWLRFGSLRYGLAAIVALVHDVAIALGAVAASAWVAASPAGEALGIMPFRIDLTMVAAVLTIIGYSLNDTIVVFDRVRENRGRLAHASVGILNDSINQTISRTLLTSGSTLLALITLYVFGGEGIRGFAFAMIVGVLIGTYSSIAIASPTLLIGSKLVGKEKADAPAVTER
ncbi:MAG: protein translocase subunit SecD, partial [Phycisphaeraceae bacterium]|nr:protein translocase subunit SecD [Phycisphaeraceae bacterium]